MGAWVWINGQSYPAERARASAVDRGLLLGEGVFEAVGLYGCTPFALGRHLARLRSSAAIVGLAVPWTDDHIRRACAEIISVAAAAEPALADGRLRITVTGGTTPDASEPGGGPRLTMMVSPRRNGTGPVQVAVSPWPMNEMSPLVGAKTTSRLEYVLAGNAAREAGADEAVIINTGGHLVEGATTNLFLVVAGRLSTPSLRTGCLGGVTRSLVCELVEVAERHDLTVDDLRFATEAFLTSTTRGVQPIAAVDGVALRSVPGPLTKAARVALENLRSSDPEP